MEQVTRCGNEMGFSRVMVFIAAIISVNWMWLPCLYYIYRYFQIHVCLLVIFFPCTYLKYLFEDSKTVERQAESERLFKTWLVANHQTVNNGYDCSSLKQSMNVLNGDFLQIHKLHYQLLPSTSTINKPETQKRRS
jgi:hypothetical protein